ncbi:hypothetical protein GCM10022222_40440 [Amycolatopsis ultiminotia]|uniref:Uncharacterized protein n=1 Tax=Amycolatopsis ultiminotia TaxID=543629 RepID=A0ABP6WLK4_9PSEU
MRRYGGWCGSARDWRGSVRGLVWVGTELAEAPGVMSGVTGAGFMNGATGVTRFGIMSGITGIGVMSYDRPEP